VPYRSGNEKPVGELYLEAYPKFVKRYAKRNLSQEDGDDCFANAFEIALHKFLLPEFTLTAPAEAFLSAVFERQVLAHYRSTKQEKNARTLAVKEQEALRLICWDRLQARTFQLLSESCQKLFRWTEQKVPTAEIAKRLGVANPEDAKKEASVVYLRRYRCRTRWEKLMREDEKFENCKPGRW